MLDSHVVSKACDPNVNSYSTVKDKVLISGEEMSPLSAKDVQCSLFH